EERGTAFLLGLTLVMVMTLLGVALFEMGTIEAGLAKSDVFDTQAFYCAEAEAARVYNLYLPANDPDANLGSQDFAPTTLTLANGVYAAKAWTNVDPDSHVVTVKATCTLPSGRTHTVQRNGKREFLNPGYEHAVVSGGFDPTTGIQQFLGDMNLGGNGAPARVGGPYVGGADAVNGDMYVSGNV